MDIEQKCANCRFYWQSACHNKQFQNMLGVDAVEDDFVELTESGELSEYIREHKSDRAYELADIVLEKLNDLEYIKKNKKEIVSYESIDQYEEFLNNMVEICDEVISSFVTKKLTNVQISFETDRDFCCKWYE